MRPFSAPNCSDIHKRKSYNPEEEEEEEEQQQQQVRNSDRCLDIQRIQLYDPAMPSSADIKAQEMVVAATLSTTTVAVTTPVTTIAISSVVNDATDDDERNVSNTSTLSSIICVVAGTGILAIAHALSQSGWIGLVFLMLSACMSQFTGIILIKCLYIERNGVIVRLKDYAEIGLAAFGKPGQIIGYVFSQLMLFLTPTIYMILASENVSELLANYGSIYLGRRACVWIISTVIGVPFILVRNMKDVSFLSTFASVATACLLLVVCVVSMSDFSENTHARHHDMVIPRNIPIAFSTFSFSYCGHVIYPQLEASMITPKRWSKVLLVSTCVISIMYFTMGVICYLVFGNTVESPIYRSLPKGSSQNVAMFVITIHVLLAIPFYLYVFTTRIESWLGIANKPAVAVAKEGEAVNTIDILDNHQIHKESQQKLILLKKASRCSSTTTRLIMRICLRIGQVVLCGVIAMFVPYFTDFMSLVGTVLSDTLTFILPTLFYMKLNVSLMKRRKIEFTLCFMVATIGVFCATFGTIDAVKELIRDYKAVP